MGICKNGGQIHERSLVYLLLLGICRNTRLIIQYLFEFLSSSTTTTGSRSRLLRCTFYPLPDQIEVRIPVGGAGYLCRGLEWQKDRSARHWDFPHSGEREGYEVGG